MKKYAISALLLGSALLLTACGNDTPGQEENSAATESTTSAQTTDVTTTVAGTTTGEAASTTAATSTVSSAETSAATSTAATSAETTEAVTTAAPATEPEYDPTDLSGLAGYWFIDGDTTLASMYIDKDGNFEAYYASGNTEATGYIQSVFNPTINNFYYTMYLDNGEVFNTFADDGLAYKTDIYMGTEGTPHFVKVFGEGGLGDDGRGSDELSFAGNWQCDRASLEITDNGEGVYTAVIRWGDSAFAHAQWDYPLIFDGEKLVCDGCGVNKYVDYSNNQTNPDVTVYYTDGSAIFYLNEETDQITWVDSVENRGESMTFNRIYYNY